MRSQLTMLFSKRILILLLFFIFSSCGIVDPPPPLDPCNTQFKGGECYMQAMQQDSLSINSYRDNAIMLNYLLEDLSILLADSTISYDSVSVRPDSLIIERKLESDSIYTEFIIPYSDYEYFYLDTMVYDTGLYHYRLATKNENGRSLYESSSINHQLPQIDSLSIGVKTCSNIPILWKCNIDVFSDTYATLKFQIERIIYNADTDTIYNIELPYLHPDSIYIFNDTTFDLGTIYEYKVAFQGRTINSLSATVQTDIPDPQIYVNSLYWIPISSDIMYLNWDIGGDLIYDSIKVSNQISDITHTIYQNNDAPTTADYLLDSLSTYSNGITAGHKVKYILQWYCQEDVNTRSINAATLPYYNMVYIPDVSDYEYTEIFTSDTIYYDSTISSSAFYIDTYEITDNVYNNPNSNTPIEANSFPMDSLSYDDANIFAEEYRQPENNSSILCNNLNEVIFKVPEDYEWQIASRCQYNWENKTCEDYFDYPISIEGQNAIPSCNYVNFNECGGEVQAVDQYSESITPFGLYGTSGNLMEWVVNNNSSREDFKLIGGSFLSTSDQIKTTSVHYISLAEEGDIAFGLRAVFDANEFLYIWRDCVDP